MPDVVSRDVDGGVRVVTLNRPERLNALTDGAVDELVDLLDEAERDDEILALVITGEGRGFCSGWDLRAEGDAGLGGGSAVAGMRLQRRTARLVRRLREGTVPAIAAVNGPAAGGGFSLALACDIRLAAPDASFHPGFIKLGISGGDLGTSWLLPRAIGTSRAFELLLTGRTVRADEAERIGLVSRVCDSGDVVAEAVEMARVIAGHAPFAVGLTKEVLWSGLETPSLYAAMETENRTQILATTTRDHAEAVAAFREGRTPTFERR